MSIIRTRPFLTALGCIVVGAVSFLIGDAVLPQNDNSMAGAVLWLFIPLAMLLSAVALAVYGARTRKRRQATAGVA